MAQIIGLPKLSPTMEEGVLVRWAKKKGDKVQPGELVAEVETDKANMDFNLEDEGVLLELLVKEGETVKLGAPVAILGKEGEDVSALIAEAKGGGGAAKKTEAKVEKVETKAPAKAEKKEAPKADKKDKAEAKVEKKEAPKAKAEAKPAEKKADKPASKGPLLASPLAKTLALELGVDLRGLTGSGPGGRIVERDVREAAEGGGAPSNGNGESRSARGARDTSEPEADEHVEAELTDEVPATAMTVVQKALAHPPSDTDFEDRPLTSMRKTIAARLTAAKRDVPHFRLQSDVDAGPLLDYRQRLNRLLGDRGKISVNDLLIKGCALALRRVPEVNAAFGGDAIRYYTRVHVGVAVALDQGLVTPVVRDADLKGIGVISAEVKDLVDRAKHRQLKAHEIQGSTFTISNLGMMPIDRFDAIINPPEAAIVAVGRIAKQPVVENDRIVIGERMTLTMSCDHRVVDGALGARFLAALIELVEQPESLAL